MYKHGALNDAMARVAAEAKARKEAKNTKEAHGVTQGVPVAGKKKSPKTARKKPTEVAAPEQ